MGAYTLLMLVCWGTAAVFLGIGISGVRRKTPMTFWAGRNLDPEMISDIPAYNRETGKMWMVYSIPFCICGILSTLETVTRKDWIAVGILGVMALSCTLGMWWLIKTYKGIFAKYTVEKP